MSARLAPGSPCAPLARFQHAGNQGFGRLLAANGIQAKLTLGASGDRFEREADRVAAAASGSALPSAPLSTSISPVGPPPLQRKCAHCQEEELQRKASRAGAGTGTVSPAIETAIQSARGGGQPLPQPVLSYFEPRFGADFARVRVHTDARAARLASEVGAEAFTSRQDIFFGVGRYQPASADGRRLLAHELTHTIQQEGTAAAPLQREEADKIPEADVELALTDKILIKTIAAPSYAVGGTIHSMVEATARGFVKQIKAEAKTKAAEFWDKVKASITVSGAAAFVLHYWWGLIKGIFSPITGLIDLAKLAVKLAALPGQILETAWTKRHELAEEAANLSHGMSELSGRVSGFLAGLKQHPLDTVKALSGWFSSLEGDAIKGAESGGRKAGHALMSQVDRPLPELGEIAGEVVGTVLINIVLLVFTEGIGNAITQIGTKLGELGSFLGKFGKAAEMLSAVVSKIGGLLDVIGGWVAKAEAAIAKVAETVLKPIAPVLEEFGKLVSGLRKFLQKLLGVSEEAAVATTEQAAGGVARAVEGNNPPSVPTTPARRPAVKSQVATSATDDAAAAATAKGAPKAPPQTVEPPVAEGKLFQGLSEDAEKLFAERPGLKKILGEHPDAAKLFKICKSPCIFPKFMTDEQVAERLVRIERMRAAAARTGVDFKEAEVKKLLNMSKSVEEVDKVLETLEQRLGKHIREVYTGQEQPPSALARTQPQTPKPKPEKLDPSAPPKQFEGKPEHLPEGNEDFSEMHGESKTPSPGGAPEKTAAYVGKEAHALAEKLQTDPEVVARLIKETGPGDIFSKTLPEGMTPEFKIQHPDFPGRKPSIDRLWRKGDTIFEIKPDTMPAAKGLTQAKQYAEWMEKYGELPPGGGSWKVEVITYDQARLTTFLRKIGKLPPL